VGVEKQAADARPITGHSDLAIVEYQRVLDSEPNYGLGNLFLGRAYLATGQTEKAVAQLRKAIATWASTCRRLTLSMIPFARYPRFRKVLERIHLN
jgi:tetratricopeptide (TPR) repeat protein